MNKSKRKNEFQSCLFCKNEMGFKYTDTHGFSDICKSCKEIAGAKYSNYDKHLFKWIYVNGKWYFERNSDRYKHYLVGGIASLIIYHFFVFIMWR